MSTVLKQGVPREHSATAMDEPADTSAVIIGGRLCFMALGTIITTALGFADSVFVLMGQEDPRVAHLACSLGARVIHLDGNTAAVVSAICASTGVVVSMCGDGSHDPCLIPDLLHRARNGCDLAVGSGGPGENFVFAAASNHLACQLNLHEGEDLGHQMLAHALSESLATSYVDSRSDKWLSEYRIAVVVPALNEELLIAETLKGMPAYLTRIYVIDDGSTDHTSEVARSLADSRTVVVRHEKNKGVGAAIINGYQMAVADGMDIVAVMAGDNQMDPAELPRLLAPIARGEADYVKGNRLVNRGSRKGMSTWRSFGNYLLTMLTKIGSGYWDIMDPQNGYTAVSRRALEALDLGSVYTYYGYCNDLLIKMNARGFTIADVAMPARYGKEKSKIRYGSYMRKVAPMMFRGFLWRLKTRYVVNDFHPLVLFYAAGMICVPLGLLLCLSAPLAFFLGAAAGLSYLMLAVFVTLAGMQSLFVAMVLDRQQQPGRNNRSAKVSLRSADAAFPR